MKSCPFCAEEIQDEAMKCRFCGETLSPIVLFQRRKRNHALTHLGVWLLALGAIGALYFFIVFDTSVETKTVTIGDETYGGRVHNLGLMQDRSMGLEVSLAFMVVGAITLYAGRDRR